MRTKFTIAVRAARDLTCAAGACALGSFFAVERSWLWLLPAMLVVAVLAGIFYRIEESLAARRDRQLAGLRGAHRRAKSAMDRLSESEYTIHPTPRKHHRVHRDPPAVEDVASALENLGYSRTEARRAAHQAAVGGPLEDREVDFESLFQRAQAKLGRVERSI